MGSSRDLSLVNKGKKEKNHMASFNKKMSTKLAERMAQSGGIKKQPTLRDKTTPKGDSLN